MSKKTLTDIKIEAQIAELQLLLPDILDSELLMNVGRRIDFLQKLLGPDAGNTNHTDSVEDEAHKQKLLVIAREWLLETDETNRNMVCMLIEDALAQYKLKLQATHSQQVEEAVERVAKAIYDEMVCDDPRGKPDWVPGGNSIKQNEARRKALQALTPNHQDRREPTEEEKGIIRNY